MFKTQAEAYKYADHFVIDMESIGVNIDNPIIVQFAVVKYGPNENKILVQKDSLEVKISVNSQLFIGREFTLDTINWWHKQDKKIIHEVFHGDTKDFLDAMITINQWFVLNTAKNIPRYLWSNGSLDDTVWLKRMYQDANVFLSKDGISEIVLPFKYNQYHCYRTALFGLKDYIYRNYKNPDAHNALADAEWQARILMDFINRYDEITEELNEKRKTEPIKLAPEQGQIIDLN